MTDIVPFQLTDEQWVNVCRHLALPEAVREDLNNLGSNYRTFEHADAERVPNSTVAKDLAQIAKVSGKLLRLLRNLGPDAVHALTNPERCGENGGPKPRHDALKRLVEQIEALERLKTWFDEVAVTVPKQQRGFDPGNLNWLIEHAARSFERQTGERFEDQHGRRKFVAAFIAVVDPEIRDGSIDNAVAALGTPRK